MDIFQTIGAILAFTLLIFQLFTHIPRLRRAFSQFIPWLKRLYRNLKEQRYWRSNHPKCRIISSSPLYIKVIDDYDYSLEIDVTMEFKNQDDYSLEFIIDSNWVVMDVQNNEHGIASRIYELRPNNKQNVVTPSNSHESIRQDFKFTGYVRGKKPSLSNSPKCRINFIGVRHPAIINGIRGIKTDYYELKVEWITA